MTVPGPRTAVAGSARRRSLASAALAFAVYGPWAFVANLGHGVPRALRAGLTQGTVSFVLTLCLTQLMEFLFALPRSPRLGFALAVAGAVTTSALLNVCAHLLAGTPEIVRTITPVVLLGTVFFVSYGANLLRLSRARAPSA